MSDEILKPKTSNEELLEIYSEIEANGGNNCRGNVSNSCVQKSVNSLSRIFEGEDDYAMIGGIPLQLKLIERENDAIEVLMREFGSRTTNDVDIISNDLSKYRKLIRNSDYNEGNTLKVDFVQPDLLDYTEDILERAEKAHIEGFDIEADIMLPTDTDLFYTKVHDGYSRESRGTRHDAEYMSTSDILDIDGVQLNEMLKGNSEAHSYVENYLEF